MDQDAEERVKTGQRGTGRERRPGKEADETTGSARNNPARHGPEGGVLVVQEFGGMRGGASREPQSQRRTQLLEVGRDRGKAEARRRLVRRPPGRQGDGVAEVDRAAEAGRGRERRSKKRAPASAQRYQRREAVAGRAFGCNLSHKCFHSAPCRPQGLKPLHFGGFSARLPTGSGQVPPCPPARYL